MNGWKKFAFLAVILIVIVGAAFFFRRLLEPRPSEIERHFDGSVDVDHATSMELVRQDEGCKCKH